MGSGLKRPAFTQFQQAIFGVVLRVGQHMAQKKLQGLAQILAGKVGQIFAAQGQLTEA